MRCFLLIVLITLLFACAIQKDINTKPLISEISYVIQRLDKATFHPVRQEWVYDYGFAPDSGMLNAYEYLRTITSFESFQAILPMSIYIQGPHTAKELDLTNQYDFGHYNPEFIIYLHSALKSLMSNEAFIKATLSDMQKYGLIEKLSRLQEIYYYADTHPDDFDYYKEQYKQSLATQNWPADGYRNFLPEDFNSSHYWNWSESVYYFWIRRDIDGTKLLWISVINDVLSYYGNKIDRT